MDIDNMVLKVAPTVTRHREYRVTKVGRGAYTARIVYGLDDVIYLDNGKVYAGIKAARDAVKAHAKERKAMCEHLPRPLGWVDPVPVILYD